MDTFTLHGLTFGWETHRDGHMNEPWAEHAGHGPVRVVLRQHSRWPEKRPGEVAIYNGSGDRGRISDTLYDFAEATRIAKRDSWGLSEPERLQLAEDLGCMPTRKQVVRQAVINDMARMKAWIDDEWGWVYIICYLLDADGNRTPLRDSLSGIESDNETYHAEVAAELAEQILHGRGDPDDLGAVTVGAVTYRLRALPEVDHALAEEE